MKRFSGVLVFAALFFFSSTCMATEFDIFKKSSTVQPFMQSAYGYVFFPKMGTGGIVVGGSYGKGEVYAMGKYVGDAVMVKTTFGLQVGGGSYSELIFFQDKRAFEDFIAGKMDYSFTVSAVGAGASAAASSGSKGEIAATSTGRKIGNQKVKEYQRGLRVFVHITGGLQAGATVSNQKIKYLPHQK